MSENRSKTEIAALNTLVKGAGIVLTGLFISKIIAYLYRMFIARYFGPADYGLFSLGLAIVSLFGILAVLGLTRGIMRYVSYYNAKNDMGMVKSVITTSLKIVLPLSLVLAIIMIASSSYLSSSIFGKPELAGVMMVLAISIPFTAVSSLLFSVFVGFQRIQYQVYSESIFLNLAKLSLIVLFGIMGMGVFGISCAWTISIALTLVPTVYYLRKAFPKLKTTVVSVRIARELLSYSTPIMFIAFVAFIISWTDTLMIGYFMETADVGIYNASLPTAQLLFVLPLALSSLSLPIMTMLHAKNKEEELKKVYKTLTRWIFYTNFPIFLLMVLFSRQILNILFGPMYISGFSALIILCFGTVLHRNILAIRVLEVLKKTRHLMYISIIGLCLNIALNYSLIPIHGINGAALATMSTYIVVYISLFLCSYHYSRISPYSLSMLKSVIAV